MDEEEKCPGYAIAADRGIRPSRRRQAKARQVTVEQVLEQLAERERTIGRMESELEMCRAQLALRHQHSSEAQASSQVAEHKV